MPLTIDQLFTPATQPEWFQTLIDNARTLGLQTTSWRAGDPERTILAIMSYAGQNTDCVASIMAQGGFLDFAATGTVTFQNPDGTSVVAPVSPDPSNPEQNPNGEPTWLDALCEQNYNTPRIQETSAGGALAIVNTSASTYGPFAAGEYHVADEFTGAGYSNVASLTIAPSSIAGTSVSTTANSGGLVKITTSTAHGLTTDDAVFIEGITGTTEANGAWYVTVIDADEFTLQGSTYTSAYVSGGTVYVPTVATFTADEPGSTSSSYNADGVLDVHTVTQAVTALVGVSVDNLDVWVGSDVESNVALAARAKLKLQSVSPNGPRGAYEYFALSAIVEAPLLDPPLTLAARITRVLSLEDLTTGYVYTFIANASGAPSVQDVATVDAVIQANCVPLAITAVTAAASEVNVAVAMDLYLPAAFVTDDNQTLFETAVQTYFQAAPIGGYTDPDDDYTNILPAADVLGLAYETARANNITIDNGICTLNGGASVSLPVSTSLASVPVLSPAVPTINLIPV